MDLIDRAPPCYDAHPECPTCHGDGQDAQRVECPACHGWGYLLCATCETYQAGVLRSLLLQDERRSRSPLCDESAAPGP